MKEEERRRLRKTLRAARRGLGAARQAAASQALTDLIRDRKFFIEATRVAFYSSIDGEVDPKPLLDHALALGTSCFLPVMTAGDPEQIFFAPCHHDTVLTANRWGIAEPPPAEVPPSPADFDVVFVPLVGFNSRCFRLGMGKGCYDRTFSFKIHSPRSRPLLIGLAHECQHCESLPVTDRDVRLDGVVTPERIYRSDTELLVF